MELPNVKHPRRVDINGTFFVVVSYHPLTDDQAMAVVVQHVRLHGRPKKKDRGKTFEIQWLAGRDGPGLLEEWR